MRSRGGSAAAVPDGEIITAMELLAATEGVLTEPAGGTTVAATMKLAQQGVIGPDDTVVVVISGNGLKTLSEQPVRPWPEKVPCNAATMEEVVHDFRRPASAPLRSARHRVSEIPHVEGVSHRTVRARGLDFHVAEAGEGDDVVLCLHGWPQHWYEWRHLMPALGRAGHRVLAMDLRGFGWSDAPRRRLREGEHGRRRARRPRRARPRAVKLVGHDWGGWIGFLLGIKAPERFDRYLALNILHPWVTLRMMAPHLWRFWYQRVILAPGLGYRLHRGGRFVRRLILSASKNKAVWDERTLSVFADNLAEPEHARAGVQMYRVFNWREALPIARGRYFGQRLTVPTLLLFGEDDFALRPELLAGYERHADDMRVELVPGCGHFIADERPELVAERAREFLAPAPDEDPAFPPPPPPCFSALPPPLGGAPGGGWGGPPRRG